MGYVYFSYAKFTKVNFFSTFNVLDVFCICGLRDTAEVSSLILSARYTS